MKNSIRDLPAIAKLQNRLNRIQLLLNWVLLLSSWAKQNLEHFRSSCSAGSSKIKIRTSSCNKASWALLHDEVRIFIFDPGRGNLGKESWEGKLSIARGRRSHDWELNSAAETSRIWIQGGYRKLSNPRGRAARAMHEFPPRKLTKSRARRAGAMRQFPSGQLDSTRITIIVNA